MYLSKFLEQFRRRVWAVDLAHVPRVHAHLYRAVRIAYLILRDFARGELPLRATSLVYTSLLSLVPLLALVFSVLKSFGIHKQLEPLLMDFLEPLGEKGHQLGEQVIAFVADLKVGVLGGVGLVVLIYTAATLLEKTEDAFNHIWHVGRARGWGRRFTDYLSVLVIGPVLVVVALSLTASAMSKALSYKLLLMGGVGFFIAATGKLLPYVLVIAAFTFMYHFMPNTRVRMRAALIAGVIAGALWETAGWGFAEMMVHTTNYTVLYSSFAIVILFFIWLYVSWTVVLIGSAIAFYVQHPEEVAWFPGALRLSSRQRERLMMAVLVYVARAFARGETPPKARDLVVSFNMPGDILRHTLKALTHGGLLQPTGKEPVGYVPGKDPTSLRINDVWRLARQAGEGEGMQCGAKPIGELFDDIDAAVERALGDLTLHDLVQRTEINSGPSLPDVLSAGVRRTTDA